MRVSSLVLLLVAAAAMAGCTTWKPPAIKYDDTPVPAVADAAPPRPVQIVEVPTPLPLPDQLKPLPIIPAREPAEPPRATVAEANKQARIEPSHDGFINAVQVYPFSDGALYQVYAAPGEVTDIALEAGEQLVGSGPVAAGDTVRWVIGNTESGTGATKRIHILLKPTQSGLTTNLVINTDRRTYHLELRAVDKTYMASVSFNYPQDQLIALRAQNKTAEQTAPIATDVDLANVSFRYSIEGDNPPWRPLRAMDNGHQVFIQFPAGIGQGEMPPLIVIGTEGNDQIPRYRVSGNYMIVDNLFAAAELRLGADPQVIVRIVRTDGKKP
jgi:P-type conjugative transfer protein TrbG